MRLIDADEFIGFIKNAYCPECDNFNSVRCRACPISDMLDAVDDFPAADQWHYPSKGEYPPVDYRYNGYSINVLACTDEDLFDSFVIAYYVPEMDEWNDYRYEEPLKAKVLAWQYMTQPKEES